MKEYRQMPAVVERVGTSKAWVRASLQTEGCGLQRPQPRCGRSAKWVLKITHRDMVKRRSWVNIAVCPHRNINPFENKVWEICIFIKKCVRSFIEVRKSCLIMFLLIFVLLLYNTISWMWHSEVFDSLLYLCQRTLLSYLQIDVRREVADS